MELINFRVGQKTISLKILDILLTERFEDNLTSLPNDNKSFIGVKDYMEIPTPIFDLGIILNKRSTQEANLSLLEVFNQWQIKQQDWFVSLENNITQQAALNHNSDIQQSSFAKWYQSFKTENEDLQAIVERFKTPHEHLNQCASELIKSTRSGQNENTQKKLNTLRNGSFTQLLRLFESAKEQLSLDYKPIIIFTTKDGINPHIGLLVDKVEDSVNYRKEDVKPLDKLTDVGFEIDSQTKNMMRGLIKLDQKHSVLIDPSAIFRPAHLKNKESEETEAYGLF